ncbi:OmpA family protein [Desulfomarina sp.]
MDPKLLLKTGIIFLLLLLIFSGCSRKTTVILLPDPDGRVGHVVVSNTAGSLEINKPGEAATIAGHESQPTSPGILSAAEIDDKYGQILSVLPAPPKHFILYFHRDSTKLTTPSLKIMKTVLTVIKKEKSQDISVIGHSDTAGDRKYNLLLSTRRARAIAEFLAENGIERSRINTTSHGEENPLIRTADNVSEPRNRRVEVVVR